MLKKDIDYYTIYEMIDDRYGKDVEYFDTFEDAQAKVNNYSDWYTSKGTCAIRHYATRNGGIHHVSTLYYKGGKLSDIKYFV